MKKILSLIRILIGILVFVLILNCIIGILALLIKPDYVIIDPLALVNAFLSLPLAAILIKPASYLVAMLYSYNDSVLFVDMITIICGTISILIYVILLSFIYKTIKKKQLF